MQGFILFHPAFPCPMWKIFPKIYFFAFHFPFFAHHTSIFCLFVSFSSFSPFFPSSPSFLHFSLFFYPSFLPFWKISPICFESFPPWGRGTELYTTLFKCLIYFPRFPPYTHLFHKVKKITFLSLYTQVSLFTFYRAVLEYDFFRFWQSIKR